MATNPFSGSFSYAGIGVLKVTVPNNTVAPLTAADVGKAVTYDTNGNGYRLVASDEQIHGVLTRVESDGAAVIQVRGFAKLPIGTNETLAVGDYVAGGADAGSIGPNLDGTSVNVIGLMGAYVFQMAETGYAWVFLG